MKHYTVLYSVPMSITFEPQTDVWNLQSGGASISFRRIAEADLELFGDHGDYVAQIEIDVDSNDLEVVAAQSWDFLEISLTCLSYHSACEIHKSRRVTILDTTPGIEERAFRQYFYNLPIMGYPAVVRFEEFGKRLDQIMAKAESDRVLRSLRWFRKGLLEDDPLDQFLFFWHGLEAINVPLAAALGVPQKVTETTTRTCKVCGEQYEDPVTVNGGIEELYERAGVDQARRKQIHSLRNGVSHGFAKVAELYGPAINLLPTMAGLLHRAISLCLAVDYGDSLQKRFERVSPVKVSEVLFLDAFVYGKEVESLGIDRHYPYFTHHVVSNVEGEALHNRSTFIRKFNGEYKLVSMSVSGRDTKVELTDLRYQ